MGWLKSITRRFLLARHLPWHWQLRRRTLDRRIAFQVLVQNEYRLDRSFGRDDRVLDIGAHIGSFTLAALRHGAGSVHCFEPDVDNFRLLKHNLSPFADRVSLHHSAVWRSDQAIPRLALHNPVATRNTGAQRVEVQEIGPGIEAISFDAIVEELTGDGRAIRLVKMDCEGAEWPILLTSRYLGRIEALCGEYHLGPLSSAYDVPGYPERGTELLDERLREQGFEVDIQPLPALPHPCGLFFAHRSPVPAR